MQLFENTRGLKTPPQSVVELIERLDFQAYDGKQADQRKRPRRTVVLPTWIQPVDENFKPIDEASQAITRDISTTGVSLIVKSAVHASQLAIRIQQPDKSNIDLVASVLRCGALGPFYDVGCKLITRLPS